MNEEFMYPCIFAEECDYPCSHKDFHKRDNGCNVGENNSGIYIQGKCQKCKPLKEFLEEEEMII